MQFRKVGLGVVMMTPVIFFISFLNFQNYQYQDKIILLAVFFVFVLIIFGVVFNLFWTKFLLQKERAKLVPQLENTVHELHEIHRKYKNLIENIPEVIYSVDENMYLNLITENIETLSGYTPEELKEEKEVLSRILNCSKIKNLVANKENVENFFALDEYKILDKSGNEKWIINRGRIKYENSTLRCEGLLIDITERKELEKKMTQSEEKYRNLIEEMLDGVALYKNHEFIYINRAGLDIFGFDSIDDIREVSLKDLLPLGDYEKYEEKVSPVWSDSESAHWRCKGRRANGEIFDLEINTHLVSFGEEEDKVLQLSFRDITELKRAEEERKRSEEMMVQAGKLSAIAELASGVAHEINNPLTGIMMNAELLKDEFEVDSENYLSVEKIFSLSQRIARIIKELSNFSKRGEGVFKETSLEDVLETSLSLMKNRLEKAYIKIDRDIDSPLPKVNVRYQEIQQVFVNIINNARQALNDKFGQKKIDPNKKITIRGRVESINAQKYVKFSFRDEGIGIPEERLDKIFDPFFSSRRPGEAIGMGLSVCEKIMQEHNGKISAESKEDEYTKIILEFPIAECEE